MQITQCVLIGDRDWQVLGEVCVTACYLLRCMFSFFLKKPLHFIEYLIIWAAEAQQFQGYKHLLFMHHTNLILFISIIIYLQFGGGMTTVGCCKVPTHCFLLWNSVWLHMCIIFPSRETFQGLHFPMSRISLP